MITLVSIIRNAIRMRKGNVHNVNAKHVHPTMMMYTDIAMSLNKIMYCLTNS